MGFEAWSVSKPGQNTKALPLVSNVFLLKGMSLPPVFLRLYCGPLVHQAALRLRRGVTPESLLSAGPIAMQLFRDLEHAVLDSLDADVWARLQKAPRRDHPRERRARSVGDVEELATRFTQMFEEEDDDDEDYGGRSGKAKTENEEEEIYRDACRIRTRHKKKSRALRTHSPVQLKKRERVCWAWATRWLYTGTQDFFQHLKQFNLCTLLNLMNVLDTMKCTLWWIFANRLMF